MKKLFTLFVFVPVYAVALQNSWTKKQSFVMELERGVAFSIDSVGFIGTGQDSADQMHNEFWKYSPVTNLWTQVATLPAVGRRNAVAFTIDGKGYVGTGIDASESFAGNNLNDFWEYNPATNAWTAKATYPGGWGMGVYFATGFSAGGKGYICCGKIGPSSYTSDLWEYKPAVNQWLQRANFPGGTRYQLVSLVIDDIAYVGLGTDENAYTNDWWMYHPGTNVWTQKTDMPGPDRASASTFTIGPRGYVAFGSDGGFLEDLWEYNPWDDSWTIRAPFPGGDRRNAIAFSIGASGFAGTGKGSAGIRRNFYEYTPAAITGENELNAETKISVYPNPATSHITIHCAAHKEYGLWKLISTDGKQAATGKAWMENFTIPVEEFSAGIYFIELSETNGNVYWKGRVVIE